MITHKAIKKKSSDLVLKVEYNCLGWPVCVLRPNDGTGELFSDTREDIDRKVKAERKIVEAQTTEAFYAAQRARLAATLDAVSQPNRTSTKDQRMAKVLHYCQSEKTLKSMILQAVKGQMKMMKMFAEMLTWNQTTLMMNRLRDKLLCKATTKDT